MEFLSQLDRDTVAHISEIAVDQQNNVKFYLQYGYPIYWVMFIRLWINLIYLLLF